MRPKIAIPSFPGSNGEVDNLKALRRCGFECFLFRWNDSREKLKDVDGYFFGAGFSYEDRGRAGMVAARDPLFTFMREEAERGKVIVGSCNGAQALVESGLIPLDDGLHMSLARNAIRTDNHWESPGFLNEWIWIKPSCSRDRCATSDWEGVMQIPIAHGEGRFVTRDPDLIAVLEENDQLAFRYCDADGNVSTDPEITPNGSTGAIAGICNPEGNVVALMPHPERTLAGDAYFLSARRWIERRRDQERTYRSDRPVAQALSLASLPRRPARPVEIFIDTIITNNEERTVEQAARRVVKDLSLKQYRYIAPGNSGPSRILSNLALFNPNKEVAYIRKDGGFYRWNPVGRSLDDTRHTVLAGISFLRRDEPDGGGQALGQESETGICYDCRSIDERQLDSSALLEVFANPHASTLEWMASCPQL